MSFKLLTSIAIVACASAAYFGSPAFAAGEPANASVDRACAADFAKLCPGQDAHSDAGRTCRRAHRAEFSDACRNARDARRQERSDEINGACAAEITKFCNTGSSTGKGSRHCLREHEAELSATCKAGAPHHRD